MSGRLVWMCPKPETPSGGVAFIHQLAALADKPGRPSIVFQMQPFSCWWMAKPIDERLIHSGSLEFRPDDIIICPEVLWGQAKALSPKKICFVQNHIWIEKLEAGTPVLVPSRYLANYVKRVWNCNVIGKVTPFLDEGVWPTVRQQERDRVLLMARRNDYHPAMKSALEAAGFTVDYVTEPLTQRQLAEHLSHAEFYVHLTHPEGFPLACLEAMRSGTIVVGTTGGGGVELMHAGETAVVVQAPSSVTYTEPAEFISRIMEQMQILRADANLRSRLWQQAYQWSLRYTAEATMKELEAIFPV